MAREECLLVDFGTEVLESLPEEADHGLDEGFVGLESFECGHVVGQGQVEVYVLHEDSAGICWVVDVSVVYGWDFACLHLFSLPFFLFVNDGYCYELDVIQVELIICVVNEI